MPYGLTTPTIERIQAVFANDARIQKIWLYGSRAKGNYKNGSDIDLTIVAPQLNMADLLRLENQIEELSLPYTVDLSLYHQLHHPALLSHIERVGIVFYETPLKIN
ncbi:MAG: nucleotidyltransferase domain-containing protein [Spirosomataceae bacterium]